MISYDARAKGGRVGYLSIRSFSLYHLLVVFTWMCVWEAIGGRRGGGRGVF